MVKNTTFKPSSIDSIYSQRLSYPIGSLKVMCPKKQVFEEPIVRVDITRARFPKICPVCCNAATTVSRLTIVSGRPRFLRHSWDPYNNPQIRRKHGLPQPNLKVLPIHVCDDHYYSDEGDDRYKSLCIIIDGFTMAFMFFALLFIGDSISRSRIVSPWAFVFAGLFILSMVLTAIAFQPTALAKAVKIVGFDSGMQNVLLAFDKPLYREEFVKQNPMSSELVSWVMKAE